jgi:hypothetical protein
MQDSSAQRDMSYYMHVGDTVGPCLAQRNMMCLNDAVSELYDPPLQSYDQSFLPQNH